MAKSRIFKPYLVAVVYLVLGLAIIVSVDQVRSSVRMVEPAITLVAFIILNLIFSHIFYLKDELRTFWSYRKIWFLVAGAIAGCFIAVFPLLCGLLASRLSSSDIQFIPQFSLSSILITLFIVSWEELWFRGIFLNYCSRYLSAVALSLVIGFLFVLVHFLNPNIDLLQTGPALFFAGAMLTLAYFRFRTIWLPIGLHFGNNYTNTVVTSTNKSDVWFGSDGYLSAIFLACLFVALAMLQKRKIMNQPA